MNTTPSYLTGLKLKTAKMSALAELAGLVSMSDASSSTVDTKYYYGGNGYANNTIIKKAISYQATCDRIVGDTANDGIYEIRHAIGDDAVVEFEYTHGDGTVETFTGVVEVTAAGGGDTVEPLNFTIHVNGKPVTKATE